MDDQRLKQLLTEIAETEVGNEMDLFPKIHDAITTPIAPRARQAFSLAKLAAAVLLVILTTVAAYAFYQEIIGGDPGLDAMNEANRITYYDISQPIVSDAGEEYSLVVKLDYAFADANRITAAYTVTGAAPASHQVQLFTNPTLTDDQGTPLMWLLPIGGGGGGGGGGSDVDPNAPVPFTTSAVQNFDASMLEGAPESLNLNLRVEVAFSTAELRADDPFGMIFAGQTLFEFSVPFNPGVVMDSAQTVESEGVEVTLQKVVIAPSLTRLEVCFDDPASGEQPSILFGIVSLDGAVIVPEMHFTQSGQNGSLLAPDQPCRSLILTQALPQQDGEWEIVITRLNVDGSETADEVVRLLEERYGITAEVLEGGGIGFDTAASEMAAELGVNITQALDEIRAELQDGVEGNWTFRFTLPE